ncbi:uncharacterized protein MELLADRAFT_108331 [Melampsora larici-populina 98AG31]|uniref:Uncharacterized protein n=1 Tax=Melampsora larici-populina (strain 98AG31 / pathotype 3-4-7) TaxID=747676 RepID=F4RSR8_MELLP|nr:uncharacterized protein MELLADRAFT_108331 [Melampsora larici-populina 98AG31]EGG04381.1 hypothetical protein MELLADRAFT_108331 [Melampsora larici-populina 98AG31]
MHITVIEKFSDRPLNDEDLPTIEKIVRILIDGFHSNCPDALGFTVEGLTLVSEKGFIRKLLILNQDLDTSIAYGISTITKNLLLVKEIQSEEDQVTGILRKLATHQNQPKQNKIEEIDQDDFIVIEDEVYWISNLIFKNHVLVGLVGKSSKSECHIVCRLTVLSVNNIGVGFQNAKV